MRRQKCATCGKSCRATLNVCPTCNPLVPAPVDAAVLTREEYAERINDCYFDQSMGMATHDVLMHHDAALREEVERLNGMLSGCEDTGTAAWEREKARADAVEAEADALKARLARIDAFSGERCEGCNGTVEYHDNDGVPLCAGCWEELRHAE